ncbi:helicase-associated domain-containing protein [Actinotalea fermentans]|uniref:Helicase XPB/Ssl2 N-terminal domain-containing protein n=1 Tax=Actinotalea fermentans TaxID=43671 RepID=A0A511YXM2_9CELL|nr:helicase-associated domain-containing protein [Actinotalea fermentans]GEN79948.1 hypothetical protein AFE02nite_16820 [Actinotalea fermentans]
MGFTQHLRARGEDGLAALLALRPDLASPPPSSIRALAARASGRTSVERALAPLDALTLQVLEAVLALAGTAGHPSGPTAAEVARATGADLDAVAAAARTLLDRSLLWSDPWPVPDDGRLRPSPGLEDVLGPYPAGLGPTLTATLRRRTPQALERLAVDTALPASTDDAAPATTADGEPALVGLLATHLAAPATVERLLDDAPPGARRVLEALTWGPPVGQAPQPGGPTSPVRTAVQWLLRHGLLAMSDTQHAVLPREIGLALRGDRTHASPAHAPEVVPAVPDPAVVAGDGARHAEEFVRLVAALVAMWGDQPASQVRTGGLGVRELRRLAVRLEVTDAVAALVVEVAEAAGLVGDDGAEQPSLVPTTEADTWLERPVGARWHALARAWLASDHATWLVGSRDEGGTTRGALDPELRRPWVPRLRTTTLGALESAGALDPEQVIEVLRWRTPRTPPAAHGVQAVLAEATALGVVGAGALTPPGRALLAGQDAGAALEAELPAAVGHVVLQGDLTGIVPGRPSPDLAALLELAAQVESRGAALTVRFTETSVRRALDTGVDAQDLLERIAAHAHGAVPQPLEYLIVDVARRHGLLRVGTASSYVRAEDPALLAGLLGDRALAGLHLFALAPTVIAAQAPAPQLAEALRERGLAPVLEGPDGQVLVLGQAPHRIRPRRGRRAADAPADDAAEARDRRLHRLAGDLLAGDRRRGEADDDIDPGDPAGPGLAIGLLREAAAEHRPVWLQLVGPDGSTSRRRVRPLRVDAGRVRVLDLDREAELTVAVHRIVDVTP